MVLLFMKHKKMFKRKEETVIKNELFNQRFKGGIHSIWLSEYPVSGHQNIRHPVIRISGIRLSDYPTSGYQTIQYPVIRISAIRLSEYLVSGLSGSGISSVRIHIELHSTSEFLVEHFSLSLVVESLIQERSFLKAPNIRTTPAQHVSIG